MRVPREDGGQIVGVVGRPDARPFLCEVRGVSGAAAARILSHAISEQREGRSVCVALAIDDDEVQVCFAGTILIGLRPLGVGPMDLVTALEMAFSGGPMTRARPAPSLSSSHRRGTRTSPGRPVARARRRYRSS